MTGHLGQEVVMPRMDTEGAGTGRPMSDRCGKREREVLLPAACTPRCRAVAMFLVVDTM